MEASTNLKESNMGACLSSGKKKKKSVDKSGVSRPLTESLLGQVENYDEMARGDKARAGVNVENPMATPTATPSTVRSSSAYEADGDDTSYVESLLASSPAELNVRKKVFPNGDWYEGEHTIVEVQDKWGKKGKKAMKHGKGMYVYQSGSKFQGYYFEGKMLAGEFYHAEDHNQRTSTYTGRFKDNHYHGVGRIVYHEGEASLAETETTHEATSTSSEHSSTAAGAVVVVKEVEYEGHFKVGMKSGHGRLRLSDGRWVEGFFKHDKLLATCEDELDDDQLSWTAKVCLPFNEVYIGPMNENYQFHTHYLQENMQAKTNESRLECKNGDVLKGYFENGKVVLPAKVERCGGGGNTWIGEVDANYEICGEGKFSYSNGDVYIGAVLRGGVKQGEGTQIATNGSTYKGSWVADEFQGVGTMKFVDGAIYTGDWVKGERHGRGTMTYHSGNVYEGEWSHDKKHGEGKAIFLNGDIFYGTYVNDRRDGQGTTTYADGRLPDRATYEDGELLQMKKTAKPITNSVKFVGRMMGLRKHGDAWHGGSPDGKGQSQTDKGPATTSSPSPSPSK